MKDFKAGNLVWIVVVAVVAVVGKKLLNAFGSGGVFNQDGAKAGDDASKKADMAVAIDQKKLTKTPVFYQNVAETLCQAMDGVGTDENMMFTALKGLNVEELKMVYKCFGSREQSVFGMTIFTGNLVSWFNAELAGDDLLKMANLWAPAGVWK
jgi:hypothetical protein